MLFHEMLFKAYIHMIDDQLIVFFVMSILIDIFSGLAKSWIGKGTESTKGLNGLIKHLLVFALVTLVYPYAQVVGFGSYMEMFILYFIVSYWISIIENLGQMGIDIPNWVKSRLKKLRDDYDKGDSNEK